MTCGVCWWIFSNIILQIWGWKYVKHLENHQEMSSRVCQLWIINSINNSTFTRDVVCVQVEANINSSSSIIAVVVVVMILTPHSYQFEIKYLFIPEHHLAISNVTSQSPSFQYAIHDYVISTRGKHEWSRFVKCESNEREEAKAEK